MPQPFHPLSRDEFAELLETFPFRRRVDAVHVHHTWRPNHSQYRGSDSIVAMWRYHTEEKGWSDIAQHVTVAPDGTIWTGRSWNEPPASAVGFNGNAMVGPFMIELIGDFDAGSDRLEGPQRLAAIEVTARVQLQFGLDVDALRLHKEMTNQKTCPGTSVDRQGLLGEIHQAREALRTRPAERSAAHWADAGRMPRRARIGAVLPDLVRGPARAATHPEDELPETEMTDRELDRVLRGHEGTLAAPARAGRAPRGDALTPETLDALRPHIVNLNQGRLSTEGRFRTSEADVEAIFGDHLEQAIGVATAQGRPLRLLFWAHGGLISEAAGLQIAQLQVAWWKRNSVYPIHFVWESGFFDALRQILTSGARELLPRAAARDVWDYTTDPAVEAAARTFGGDKIWLAMKTSAARASAEGGGGAFVAQRLRDFCVRHGDRVELHAVGHSAGSIFHAHFLPTAKALGVPGFRSLHLLAPAVRADEFGARLAPLLDGWVRHLTLFTMRRDWEEADDVAGIYQKSLLYLVHHALESETRTPILGLESTIRDDASLRGLFGLQGGASPKAEVVWSVTSATTGRAASTSKTHGGFDNDRPTMNSVLRRILGADQIIDFPDEAIARAATAWAARPTLPAGLTVFGDGGTGNGAAAPTATSEVSATPVMTPVPSGAAPGGERRRALCIGIDTYPTAPLAGCVADARLWARTLESLGFAEPRLLLDGEATRAGILDALGQLVRQSLPGDVVVFQYAGHGTTLPDVDGDEAGGDTGDRDEALCPADMATGAFVNDDDIREVFRAIPDGVSVTCFFDCCHSGTITRFAARNVTRARARAGEDRRPRYLRPTPQLIDAHRRFRAGLGVRAVPTGGPEEMREVVFSACLSSEVAYESQGQGDFTRRATALLAQGIASVSHEEFLRRVVEAFGPSPAQHPNLDCAPGARGRGLLTTLASPAASNGDPGHRMGGPPRPLGTWVNA